MVLQSLQTITQTTAGSTEFDGVVFQFTGIFLNVYIGNVDYLDGAVVLAVTSPLRIVLTLMT